jgi:putative ABC transport system permease protein
MRSRLGRSPRAPTFGDELPFLSVVMSVLLQNVRVGIRSLLRAPAFAATVAVTLALGIGLATAIFTVADAFLIRPLPVRDQHRVVVLWGATPDGRFDNYPLLLDDAREFARQTRTLERVEFFGYGGAHAVAIREDGRIFRLRRALASGGFFELLGTRPVLGRTLRREDDVRGAAPVVVLSHAAWRQHFGGDRKVIGRRLVIHESGEAQTIVGVMPQGIDYPRGTEFWAPVMPGLTPLGRYPLYAELQVLGRLRPAASVADARAELTTFFARGGNALERRDVRGVAHPLTNAILGDVRPAVLAFAAAAGLLLLIACINLATLLLVRGLARVREIAVRAALGAGRLQIVGQLVTESALLAVVGGALGTALAAAAVRTFVAFAPADVPRLDEVHVNGTAIVGAAAITAIVTLLFAVAPAVVTSRVELQEALRSGTRQSGGGRRFRLGTEALVAGQVALAVVVLSAAGLITRSLIKLERAPLAFEPSHLLIAELALPFGNFGDTQQQYALLERLVPRLEAVPGVRAVSPVLSGPFSGSGAIKGVMTTEGQSETDAARNPILDVEVVTPNYFATFGVRVLRGRAFTDEDRRGALPVVVLSESAAQYHWPGSEPIGKRLTMGPGGPAVTVAGIVRETRYHDLRDARPAVYFPLRQSPFPVAPMTLAIRVERSSVNVVPAIRRAIAEVDAGVALASAAPVETLLERPRAQPRLNAFLLSVFALAATVLAAIGLYGVMATMVRQRTRELGVRMALGATGGDLLRMVVGRGVSVAAVGAAAGLVGAAIANRTLQSMLFEVSPTDVPTLGLVALVLLAVATLASTIPARSGARVDPVVALRADG